jgi:hypothetical protein
VGTLARAGKCAVRAPWPIRFYLAGLGSHFCHESILIVARIIHVMIRVPDQDRSMTLYADAQIKRFKSGNRLLSRFFFLIGPVGYKIAFLERWGHYQ